MKHFQLIKVSWRQQSFRWRNPRGSRIISAMVPQKNLKKGCFLQHLVSYIPRQKNLPNMNGLFHVQLWSPGHRDLRLDLCCRTHLHQPMARNSLKSGLFSKPTVHPRHHNNGKECNGQNSMHKRSVKKISESTSRQKHGSNNFVHILLKPYFLTRTIFPSMM